MIGLMRMLLVFALVYAAFGVGLWFVHEDAAGQCQETLARQAILSRAEGIFYLDRPEGPIEAYAVFWAPAMVDQVLTTGRQSWRGFLFDLDCVEDG